MSSQLSLVHMFAAQREKRARTDAIPPNVALDSASTSSSASLSKQLFRPNRHYAKTGKRKYEKEGCSWYEKRYEKDARFAGKEMYEVPCRWILKAKDNLEAMIRSGKVRVL